MLRINCKQLCAIGAVAAGTLLASAAQATTFTITDATNIKSYRGTNPYNCWPSPCASSGSGNVGDVVQGTGHPFDTQEVVITVSGLSVEFQFYTKFDGSDLGAYYADIFLATDPGSPDLYDFGISLGLQSINGGVSAGLYDLAGPGDYKTSQQIWASRTGFIYGGRYLSPDDNQWHYSPTVVTGGTQLLDWAVSISQNCNQGGSYPCLLDVTLTALNAGAFASVFGNLAFGGFWGTGDCSNDAILWRDIPTPEPGSILLVGGGLLGLFGLRRHRAAHTR